MALGTDLGGVKIPDQPDPAALTDERCSFNGQRSKAPATARASKSPTKPRTTHRNR
jgi:hypothetical protein